jgi:hypothetical protein
MFEFMTVAAGVMLGLTFGVQLLSVEGLRP